MRAKRRSPVHLESVQIIVNRDPNPDPSYLDQEEFEDRRESYNRGDFEFLYVRAEAEVVVGDIVQTMTSGGLYGIESDSGKEYFMEIAAEEWSALRDVLKTVGVPTSQLPQNIDRKWVNWRT